MRKPVSIKTAQAAQELQLKRIMASLGDKEVIAVPDSVKTADDFHKFVMDYNPNAQVKC